MKGKILLSSMVALNLLPIAQILASETKNLETVEITSEDLAIRSARILTSS
ncbi:hypothetical protein [Campylobacter sp.]|uniref:hypothetical protein n=1 Tax=Campylobacter sp. TaxID=205 RepID=UPI0025BB974A|nr:hypothetical protein [Campylobacter sp.]